MKKLTFIQAMKDYFGLHANQTAMQFMLEIKALSIEERDWFRSQPPSVGYEIVNV